jgi:hypothetical protein
MTIQIATICIARNTRAPSTAAAGAIQRANVVASIVLATRSAAAVAIRIVILITRAIVPAACVDQIVRIPAI